MVGEHRGNPQLSPLYKLAVVLSLLLELLQVASKEDPNISALATLELAQLGHDLTDITAGLSDEIDLPASSNGHQLFLLFAKCQIICNPLYVLSENRELELRSAHLKPVADLPVAS